MMSPNKNKRGVAPAREVSPEVRPSSPKPCGSNISSDTEESVPRKGGPSQHGASLLRSLGLSGKKKPAELFRKDLISAMKLADKDSLPEEAYFLISDPWRQEWEKGVQVPVNVTDMKQAIVSEVHEKSKTGDFKMPLKMLHERRDEVYKKGQHHLTGMPELMEQVVRYDLDDLDVCWLEELNFRLREMGLQQITEWNMERVIEAVENECHKNMSELLKTAEGVGIEYDEDVVCDVCRSPDSEESNEMVFCDKCNICIHQVCYGIQTIPQGTWMCRTCALGIRPTCLLCPNMGGAMKSTRSGTQWVHVSCALWIPEVGFGDPDKVEPVTKISHIPASRWSLTCCVCKERQGACIQCSVKSCKIAFHVTCAFSEGLHMKTIMDEKGDFDDISLKAYCPKHSKRWECSHSESELDTPRKKSSTRSPQKRSSPKDRTPSPKKEMTQEERANQRLKKLKALEEEFYKTVEVSKMAKALQLEEDVVDVLFVYWKLKRKCNWNRPLLTPKTEEEDILEKQEEDSRAARRKLFVHLRHDLERARNLCYMISKREKMKRQLFHNKQHVFKNMARVLKNKSLHLSKANIRDIVQNYHFDSIYDDYGLSVQKLPGELSEDERESSETEDNASASSISTGPGEKHTVVRSLFLADTGSDRTFKPGQLRRGYHKTRRKGRNANKMWELENKALATASEVSASPYKSNSMFLDDDNIPIMSANESEDEMVRRLPGTQALKEFKGGKMTLWSSTITTTGLLRRVKQKKSRRGRKPWYEKQNQHFELTPNLALSTDDDEDTKDSCSVESGKGKSLGKRDASEKNVEVDVIREEEAGQKTVPSSSSELIRRRRGGRRKKMSESVQTSSDPRTKLKGEVAPGCDRTSKRSENTAVGSVNESENAPSVLPSCTPAKTINRKRRNLEKVVSDTCSEVSKLEDSSCKTSNVAIKSSANTVKASMSEAERTPSLSPAKIRKTGRGRRRRGEIEKDNTASTPDKQMAKVGKSVPVTDNSLTNKELLSPKLQDVKSDLLSDSTQSCRKDRTVGDAMDGVEVREGIKLEKEGSGEERVLGVGTRKGRQSSLRAHLVWNKLLTCSGMLAAIARRQASLQLRCSQDGQNMASSSTSTSHKSAMNKSANGTTIKQETDAEIPPESDSSKAELDLKMKPPSLQSVDPKVNNSKHASPLAFEDMYERANNGCRGRYFRQGKRSLLAHGVVDNKQRKNDVFFTRMPETSLAFEEADERSVDLHSSIKRVLNEISADKRGNWENSHAGNDSPSRDSLGKPSDEQMSGKDGILDSGLCNRGEGSGEGSECVKKTDYPLQGKRELVDAVSAFRKGQCGTEQFSMDGMRAFRSQSPSSDASTATGRPLDSRESTPRRFTRSQLSDRPTENLPHARDTDPATRRRTLSRGHRAKVAKAAS